MDRHTAADPAEAMDPDLDLPAHSDPFDAIETNDGVFATELRFRDGPGVYDARSDEDADGGEHGEDDADCQQHPDGERNIGLVPDEASVGVQRVEKSPADRKEREPRPVHAAGRGFEVHGAADAGPGVLVVPPVTVGTAPRHTAGSGLSAKSVREPGLTRPSRRLPWCQPRRSGCGLRRPMHVLAPGRHRDRSTTAPVDTSLGGSAAPAGGRPPRLAPRRRSETGEYRLVVPDRQSPVASHHETCVRSCPGSEFPVLGHRSRWVDPDVVDPLAARDAFGATPHLHESHRPAVIGVDRLQWGHVRVSRDVPVVLVPALDGVVLDSDPPGKAVGRNRRLPGDGRVIAGVVGSIRSSDRSANVRASRGPSSRAAPRRRIRRAPAPRSRCRRRRS